MDKKDVFGSPDAHDATAEWDKLVEESAQDHAEMFNIARTEVMNRRVGSKKVSPKEQLQEYEVIKGMAFDGDYRPGVEFLAAQDATLEEAVNWAFEMENKLRNA